MISPGRSLALLLCASLASLAVAAPQSPTGSLSVELHQTEPGQVTGLTLSKLLNHGRTPGPVIRTIAVNSRELIDTINFENLEPGEYAVVASGAKPSQRHGQRTTVVEGHATPLFIDVLPFSVRLRASRDGESLAGARVVLRHLEAMWEADVDLGSDGTIVELWQGGRVAATVLAKGSVPWRTTRTIEHGTSGWSIELSRQEVTGTVIDAKTKAPIANAAISLEMRPASGGMLSISERSGSDGTFRLAPVPPGLHTIRAGAKGYPVTTTSFILAAGEESHAVTVAMNPVPMTMLQVADARGVPIAGAWVLSGADDRTKTNAAGLAPLFVPEGEARDVFIVPPSGSLGVIRVASGIKELPVRIADGSSRIVLQAQSEHGEAIERMAVGISYAGRELPRAVEEELWRRGARFTTDASGRIVLDQMPPGLYELTAAGRLVRIAAVPGENVAVLTFE